MTTNQFPVVRPSAHMRATAYILRTAARFNGDAENASVYLLASANLEEEADKVDETEGKLAIAAGRIAKLEALLSELHDLRGQINYDSVIWQEVGDIVGKVTK